MSDQPSTLLFLGAPDSPLLQWLCQQEPHVLQTSEPITADFITQHQVNFLISYGYRHIIKADVLQLLPRRAINLHIAYLPWNRGADPNLWSFVENSPKGVTIHYLDPGVDTGDIIVQKQVEFNDSHETLATTYQQLQNKIQALFRQHWPAIRSGQCEGHPQQGPGSLHRLKDKERLLPYLPQGWNTPVSLLKELPL